MNNENIVKAPNLKNLTTQDFLNFGIQDIAYIRPIIVDQKSAFVLHAADGTALSVMDSLDTAINVARHNELEAVSIQ